jgi:para-aminobenzoate synthetase/4-amino-4-deoxychorismate lyase
MIVDLIRNDFGRVSEYGSVNVKNIFEVEKYESVYQMVSTIEAKLKKKVKLSDVIKNIFPCGSITGAPKIHTMEIINELEKENRGIYTGSIGLIRKNKITFNVPIRTLAIDKKSNKGEIGLGSGIVWDSVSNEEYDETKLKGNFLTEPVKPFEIFETMLVESRKIFLPDDHLDRMQKAAEFFLFVFDRNKIIKYLDSVIKKLDNQKYRLKLTLDKWGRLNHFVYSIVNHNKEVNVIISEKTIDSRNKFQYFKTTNRNLYDDEYKKYSEQGYFDVLFFNEKGELAEGAITNIFIHKNEKVFTPPLSAGILYGVYRRHFIKNNSIVGERKLYLQDLLETDKIVLTNSVRGEVVVKKLFLNDNEFIEYK